MHSVPDSELEVIEAAESPGSIGSVRSIGSVGSILSIGSLGSILSIGSAGSLLSIGSVGSILSIGSAGSVLSIGSRGSILSIGATRAVSAIGTSSRRVGARHRRSGRATRTVDAWRAIAALRSGRDRRPTPAQVLALSRVAGPPIRSAARRLRS